MKHNIDVLPEEFQTISNKKTDFKIASNNVMSKGDIVVYREIDGELTGNEKEFLVKYIVPKNIFSKAPSTTESIYLLGVKG